MSLSEQRISQLADIMCIHLAFGHTSKALLIAQYIRQQTGTHLHQTAYRGIMDWKRSKQIAEYSNHAVDSEDL